MRSPVRWILLGLVVAAAGLAYGVLPQSEQYSDFGGFSDEGAVDVECGSAFSENVNPVFDDFLEGEAYFAEVRSGYEPAIFGGQTAIQVCDDLLSGTRSTAIVGLAIGAVLALVGRVRAAGAASSNSGESSGRRNLDDLGPPPLPPASPPPTPPPPPPVTPSAPEPPAEPAPTPTLQFGDGRQVNVIGQLIIGRDPAPSADASSTDVLKVNDVTVSKTHLCVGAIGDDVWIEDLHSRNGVSIVASNGEVTIVDPGRRMVIDIGDQVVVGDSTSFIRTNRSPPTSDRTV